MPSIVIVDSSKYGITRSSSKGSATSAGPQQAVRKANNLRNLLGSASRTSSLTHWTVHATKSTTPRAQPLFTKHTSNKEKHILLMSLWFLLVCHALTQNDAESPVSIFLLTFTKAIKNTCPHKKSLHQDLFFSDFSDLGKPT